MRHIVFSSDSEWWSGCSSTTSNDIAVILNDKKNTSDTYDQTIMDLEKSIKEVQSIVMDYTAARSEYQSIYNTKRQTIRDLQAEYERIVWDRMSDWERQEFEDQKQREAEMWQHIFSGMGFDQSGMRWEFETEEEFFQHHQQEQKKSADANYVKKNMEEVKGELVDKIKDLPLKTIYRKISLLLHPDKLLQNQDVAPYPEYIAYLHGVYLKVIDAWEKEDKAAMIIVIQEAWISYQDGEFSLATYQDFREIAIDANKKSIIKELQDRLQVLKTSYVYMFYLKHTQWETQKELRDLDDKIQELEDLIASYQTTDEQPSTVK